MAVGTAPTAGFLAPLAIGIFVYSFASSKWTDYSVPIQVGTMVLLKDFLSSLQWLVFRSYYFGFSGSDGIVRVVTMETSKGVFKRPVNKVCPLLFI